MSQPLQLVKVGGPEQAEESVAHVVFVHGLGGHPYETWQDNPKDKSTFWPQWLIDDLPGINVWTLGYDAAPVGWINQSMSLLDRSVSVLQKIVDEDELKTGPIAFVCHSLGGLIVKQIIRQLSESFDKVGSCSTLNQFAAVVYYGTPHTGSNIASFTDKFRFIVWPTATTKSMMINDSYLRNLNVWYRNAKTVKVIEHRTYIETQPVALWTVVESTSGDAAIAGDKPIPLDGNHFEICKPADRRDSSYDSTLKFLRDEAFNQTLSSESLPRRTNDLRPIRKRRKSVLHYMPLVARLGLILLIVGIFLVVSWSRIHPKPNGTVPPITMDGSPTITVSGNQSGGDINTTVNIDNKNPLVDELVDSLSKQLDVKDYQLGAKDQQIAELSKAIQALVSKKDEVDAPEGIDAALDALAEEDTTKAEAIFQSVIDAGESESQITAEAYRHLGALAYLHDTTKSLDAYRRSTELDPANEEGWNQLGHLYDRIGELAKSEEAYKTVLRLSDSDKKWQAIAFGNLGTVYRMKGKLDQAEAMYERALAIDEVLGRKEGMANQYGNLGNVYRIRGELDQAVAMYEMALAIDEEPVRKEGISSHYGNLGTIYLTRGGLVKAESMYKKALAIDEELGRKEGMASHYGNLVNVYRAMNKIDQAVAMLEKSLSIEEELGHKEGMASDYGNLGIIYIIKGELVEAEAMYKKALSIDEELGRKEGIASHYGNLGIIYYKKGELVKAESMYKKALSINKELGHKEGIAIQHGNLGNVYRAIGEFSRAIESLKKAKVLFDELGSPKKNKVQNLIEDIELELELFEE